MVVADYIAGMTDRYALNEVKRRVCAARLAAEIARRADGVLRARPLLKPPASSSDCRAPDLMNIFDDFHARIAAILDRIAADGRLPELDHSRFVVEPPKDAALGDLASQCRDGLRQGGQAAFRHLRASWRSRSATRLRNRRTSPTAEVAGPGFINIRLKPADLCRRFFAPCCAIRQNFGRVAKSRSGALQGKVNVEYVSANPTGPMHVGHGRGAVFGDALANLLAFSGCEVTREYYINDAGAQVDVLARSAYLRYREALGEAITIPEGLYPGDYLKPVGAALAKAHGSALARRSRRASGCPSFAPPPSTR